MQMFSSRSVAGAVLFGMLVDATILAAQSTHAAPPAPPAVPGLEFPVQMRQKVEAGKTPVGTKIEAKLIVATLVNGVVIPQDAILSGEVIESASKTAGDPSRLTICLESAEWKNGSTPASLALPSKIYLTSWYYPFVIPPKQDFLGGLPDATHGTSQRLGGARYPNPSTKDAPPYSSGNTDTDKNPTPGESSTTSATPHRERMKSVQSIQKSGVVALVSAQSTIKLDKSTTYVFAPEDLGANSRVP
jgi:hypothetical protein